MRPLAFVCLLCQFFWLVIAPSSPSRLIYANRMDIRIISTTNSKKTNETVIIDGLDDAIALDFYYKEGLVFWTDVNEQKIKKTHIYAEKRKAVDVISVGLRRPEGLAVDWVTKKLYWTDLRDSDWETNRIEISNLDGSQRKVLFWQDLEQPRAIALDPLTGYMFWTDWGENAKIEKAGMDGSNRTTIVSKNIYWPNGLTLDYDDRKIYWTDAKLNYIACADYDGLGRRTILRGLESLPHPFALTVYDSVIYWTDWTSRAIHSCNKKNGQNVQFLATNIYAPMDIHVYEANRQRARPRELNPCAARNGDCSHLCLLAPKGQKSCACPTGVRLQADGRNCEQGPNHFLLLARKTDIRRISLDTPDHTDVVLPISNIRHAIAIDYNAKDNYIYWTDDEEQCINRARMNGTSQLVVEVIVTSEIQHPDGLAVDWIAQNLYWTDTGTDRIEVSRLNGSSRKVLISENIHEPRAIVLYPQKGYMYWTDWGKHPKVERADLDGDNRMVLVNQSIVWPNGLCIDYAEEKIYWVDAKLDKIVMMGMDGRHQRIILNKGLPHVFGFTLLGTRLYWTDWQSRFLESVDKRTGQDRKKVIEQLPDLMGLKAVDLHRQDGSNACQQNNGGCSHLCLYTPLGPRCMCPSGLEIKSDKKTCTVPEAFLLFVKQTDIRRISLNLHNGDRVIPLVGIKDALALDFHVANMHIYWSDGQVKAISRACLNGSGYEQVVNIDLDYPDGIAVDWIGRNLYWTDSGRHRIEVARLDGHHRKTLIWKGLWEPRSLALDPVNGTLYWTNGGKSPNIEKADMDGMNRVTIINGLKRPNGLSIDLKARLLFWADAENNVIECSNLDGTRRRRVATSLPKPFALTLFDDFMYWSDWRHQSIERANKTNGKNRTTIQNRVDNVPDIQVYHASKQEGWNACADNNAGCTHLCLSKPHEQVVCTCSNHFELSTDNKTCQAPVSFLLFSSKDTIRRMTFESPDQLDVVLPINNLSDVIAIAYDIEEDFMYWVDGSTNSIRGAFQNGTSVRVIISGDGISPYDLAVDPYGRQLFWTDSSTNRINIYSLKRRESIGVVVEGPGIYPRSIALFPEKGQMYWTDISPAKKARIYCAGMDGDMQMALISSDIKSLGDLAIDKQGKKLYWTETELKRIEYANLEKGSSRAILVERNILNPVGLAVHGGFVYWIDKDSRNVEKIPKMGQGSREVVQGSIDDLSDLLVVDYIGTQGNHACKNNNCTHICVVRYGDKQHCSCPKGMVLNDNNSTCGAPPTCSDEEFTCSDGQCILDTWVCDGQKDCLDDEQDCPTCQPGFWHCRNSSRCIEDKKKCDGTKDCADGSDEANGDPCRPKCEPGYTHCADDLGCYGLSWRCDGHPDCKDRSDERDCTNNDTSAWPPREHRQTLNVQMIGGIVASIVICIVICILAVLIWWRIKRGPGSPVSSHEIGLVVTPVLHAPPPSCASSSSSSNRGSLCTSALARKSSCPLGSNKYLKSFSSTSNRTGTGTSHTLYDRNNITGASCSSTASTIVSAYPREPLNPPPSPVTERSQYTTRSRGYCDSFMSPSSCTSHRYHRPWMPPPPSLASGFESASASDRHRSRRPHRCRNKRHSSSICTDVAYESDLFAPPPTPNTNYLSEATHYSDQECPPSPTTTERSYFHPYPPPPSPVTDAPSLV